MTRVASDRYTDREDLADSKKSWPKASSQKTREAPDNNRSIRLQEKHEMTTDKDKRGVRQQEKYQTTRET